MNSNIHLNFSLNCWEALRVFKTTAIRKEKPRFDKYWDWPALSNNKSVTWTIDIIHQLLSDNGHHI